MTLGAMTLVMFTCRFFLFHLYESPKFLLSQGRQPEAVAAVHGIAYKNRKQTWLSEDVLNEIGGTASAVEKEHLSMGEIVNRNLGKFSTQRIGPLFRTKKLGLMSMSHVMCLSVREVGIWDSNNLVKYPSPEHLTDRNFSMPYLVLLDDYWHGISPLQCFLTSVSRQFQFRTAHGAKCRV